MAEEEVEMRNCHDCDNEYPIDDLSMTADDEYACSDCVRICAHCDNIGIESWDWYNVDDESWCQGCWENESFGCGRCDNYYNGDRTGRATVCGNGWQDTWCEYCYGDHADYCENCDEYYASVEGACPQCGESDDEEGGVHNYSYKPNPIFHGVAPNNLYMGFELEMELNSIGGSEYRTAVSLVQELESDGVCYLKSDSSINGTGFELVTNPHTLGAYEQAYKLWEYIELLRTQYQARSYDTNSCGLHVHVSRSAFKSGAHIHRFLSLIYKNPKEMMKLAGRKNSRYAKFNDVYKEDEWGVPRFNLRDKIHAGGMTERYSAVNTNNDYTLELRFFRGNMKREGIMSALELCHASVEYTRNMSVSDVKLGMLKWDWFADWVEANNGLYPNLYLRMSKVASVSLDNRPLINA